MKSEGDRVRGTEWSWTEVLADGYDHYTLHESMDLLKNKIHY